MNTIQLYMKVKNMMDVLDKMMDLVVICILQWPKQILFANFHSFLLTFFTANIKANPSDINHISVGLRNIFDALFYFEKKTLLSDVFNSTSFSTLPNRILSGTNYNLLKRISSLDFSQRHS